jgi:hypothetical protein
MRRPRPPRRVVRNPARCRGPPPYGTSGPRWVGGASQESPPRARAGPCGTMAHVEGTRQRQAIGIDCRQHTVGELESDVPALLRARQNASQPQSRENIDPMTRHQASPAPSFDYFTCILAGGRSPLSPSVHGSLVFWGWDPWHNCRYVYEKTKTHAAVRCRSQPRSESQNPTRLQRP